MTWYSIFFCFADFFDIFIFVFHLPFRSIFSIIFFLFIYRECGGCECFQASSKIIKDKSIFCHCNFYRHYWFPPHHWIHNFSSFRKLHVGTESKQQSKLIDKKMNAHILKWGDNFAFLFLVPINFSIAFYY